jgi:hypothetical protein
MTITKQYINSKKSINHYSNSDNNKSVYFQEIKYKNLSIKTKLSKNQKNKFKKYGLIPNIDITQSDNMAIGNHQIVRFRAKEIFKRQQNQGINIKINGLNYCVNMFKNANILLDKDYKIIQKLIINSITI